MDISRIKVAESMREDAIRDDQGNIICSPELWELLAKMIEDTSDVVEETIVDIKDWFVNKYESSDFLINKVNSIVAYVREHSKEVIS